ncbi:hypothetical protein F8M41_003205 [Gigaspora margarita]|uniref:Uncharacterized protein n=1 Tax=Gigaspora margarita TaxID=4874 RepID=A0A8H4AYE5_GIGMA|nr:hypothetical protein F8M41_003205 [Gigaspora margarita]
MDKQKTLARNNANQIVQESILTGLSFDLIQLDMSDSEPNNEPDNKRSKNLLLAKNSKGKVTQNACSGHILTELIDQLFSDNDNEDNSDNEDNWKDINNDKTSEYSTNNNLTEKFISFDAHNSRTYNDNSDEPVNNKPFLVFA